MHVLLSPLLSQLARQLWKLHRSRRRRQRHGRLRGWEAQQKTSWGSQRGFSQKSCRNQLWSCRWKNPCKACNNQQTFKSPKTSCNDHHPTIQPSNHPTIQPYPTTGLLNLIQQLGRLRTFVARALQRRTIRMEFHQLSHQLHRRLPAPICWVWWKRWSIYRREANDWLTCGDFSSWFGFQKMNISRNYHLSYHL